MFIFAQSEFSDETPVYIPTGLQNMEEGSTLYLNTRNSKCKIRDGL